MVAQQQRLLVISQNLANATAKNPDGSIYQRQTINFLNMLDSSTGLRLVRPGRIDKDSTPGKLVYKPGDPNANADGFVEESNVNSLIELADMREASRSHEANVKAYEKILSMLQEIIGLLKV